MYGWVLLFHSWLRWVVLALGLAALARAGLRWRRGGWRPTDEVWGAAFLRALDVQVALGLLMYFFLSPLAKAGRVSLEATLSDATLRFYTIEHIFGMLVGIAVAQAGWSRSKRSEDSVRRAQTLTLAWTVWLAVTVASVPWPYFAYGRPLLRF